ncbi:hypothetical protein KVR01_007877 [Diaporthe batatas]|uniref:uncharacterized protein n=1 Tax=Diaporthe batatas TaxID=748121 RepID=UPI001D05952C|nr:uncharacterized protein KVR01_007877 [Diaporthe batatas]KAG8162112.1 hypothetical protein KVR01_007877 [Diaporthe batatas]
MGPKRLMVTLTIPRRKDGPASSRTEEPIASNSGDGDNMALARTADETSDQSRGLGVSESSCPAIKQEGGTETAETPSASASNMKETCDKKSTTSGAAEGKHSVSSPEVKPNSPDSMDIDNGPGTKTTMGEPLPFVSDNDNNINVNALGKAVGPTNEAEQPTPNILASIETANKAPNRRKRKAESSSDQGPPTKKKPGAYRKPRKPALEAAKYVSHANSLVLSGKTAEMPEDIDLNLPTISQAPANVRDHLRALEKAGLKLARADPETIKTHVKVLGGLCHVFKNIEPWLFERDGEPRVDDFKWKVQGLKHPLHSHQMLGSAIMIVIERDENQGSGLLLDFMGFGKTVQTLTCVVSNLVSSNKGQGKGKEKGQRKGQRKGQNLKDGSATTLVVVRKSAAPQWVDEVKEHTNSQLSVILWTRQTEITRDATLAADILVVTYDQVRAMLKACKSGKITSLLFEACFQRIVLDEAHRMKNRNSETFKACMCLKGKHRWALTGTPIPNGAHELWPLLRFIQHPSVKDFPHFKKDFLAKLKSEGGVEYEDLRNLLMPITIMRTPRHQFCGIPLVNLPQDHAVTEVVPLSAEEKVILAYLEGNILSYLKMKHGGRCNYLCLRERFTRYRQFSASPLLLEAPVKDGLWTIEQVGLMKGEAHNTGATQTPIMDLFEQWILEPKQDHLAPTGHRRIDSTFAEADLMVCPLCWNAQTTPMLAECGHIWCKECVEERQKSCRLMEIEISCRKCKRLIGEVRPYNPEAARDPEQDAARSQKGVDHNGFQPAGDEGSTLFQYLDQNPEASIPLNTKMKRMLDLILKWKAEAPKDKIIVFFHFIGVGRLLGRLLQGHGIGYLYFVGKMNSDQRQDARVAFEEDEAVKVLMVSITTGGEALNLTMANRCIIYDPWWHRAVEEQAFGRVNRIGQQKETHCVRLFAEGTIDDRMNDLQKKKKKQQSAIAELEASKGLTAKTLRQILDGRSKEGGSDGSDADTDSEDSGDDDEDDGSESEPEDPNDGDWVA